MEQAHEPVEDDELVYRRVPLAFAPGGRLSYRAFLPRDTDTDGLSLVRVRLATPEQAARSMTGRPCFLAVLRVGDIRRLGLDIEPAPIPGQPGHCLIPSLVGSTADHPGSRDLQGQLATLVRELIGPVLPDAPLP